MMNILFVVQHYYPEVSGGAGKSVQTLAENLVQKGHKVTVVKSCAWGDAKKYDHNGVDIYAMPVRNIYYYDQHAKSKRPAWMRMVWHMFDIFNPWSMWDFNKILNEVKPDIVNTNTLSGFSTSLFYLVKWKGIRLVHTMRDYYLMCPQSSMYKNGKSCDVICKQCKPFALARRHAARNVDVFLSNSQFVQDRHEEHKMFPVGAMKFPQYNMNTAGELSKVREIDKAKSIRLGFIGNLIPTKGLEVLLAACNQIPSDEWTLKIAGAGTEDYVSELKMLAGKNINFIGWAKSDEFYKDIDILICPSTYHDPLPRVIYEAYKAGLPVIASDTGGNPEIIEHDKTGYIYPAYDQNSLVNYLQKAMNLTKEDYAAMSLAALEKAKMFEPENILQEYEEKITCKI